MLKSTKRYHCTGFERIYLVCSFALPSLRCMATAQLNLKAMSYEPCRITKIFHQIKDEAQVRVLLLKAVSRLHHALETEAMMQRSS